MSSWTSGPMNEVTCVSGESFVVSDIGGDVLAGGDHGFYVRDTRVLSGLGLRVDGEPVLALHAGVTGPGRATFHGFVRLARSRAVDPVLLLTRRRVGDVGLHEDVLVANHGRETVTLRVAFELEVDFAYVFDVKHGRRPPLAEPVGGACLRFRRGEHQRLEVVPDPPARCEGSMLAWDPELNLKPGLDRLDGVTPCHSVYLHQPTIQWPLDVGEALDPDIEWR